MSLGTDSRIVMRKIYKQEGSDSLSFPSVILADMTVWHNTCGSQGKQIITPKNLIATARDSIVK